MTAETRTHTPPLGHKALTPLYDLAIAALTRESVWRRAFVLAIAPKAGEKVVDIGSGTGSLAIAVHNASPKTTYIGVDPDEDAVERARAKVKRPGAAAKFEIGYFSSDADYLKPAPDKIISSLVLHQVPLAEKQRIVEAIYKSLKPGGSVHIADYGLQKGLLRFLFRITVQALDGVKDTQPSADGIILELLDEAGFSNVEEAMRIPTVTGTISLYRACKLF
ncbi:MAG: hypothetical protein DHS20C05_13260 [Hyphococcus sp.]|nr:MAG: hypothetical protein DHS20C05_13260 [Marinicaulis sp.]